LPTRSRSHHARGSRLHGRRRRPGPAPAAAPDPAARGPRLVLAFACLAGLLSARVGALSLREPLDPATLAFPWQDHWAEVLADPARGAARRCAGRGRFT